MPPVSFSPPSLGRAHAIPVPCFHPVCMGRRVASDALVMLVSKRGISNHLSQVFSSGDIFAIQCSPLNPVRDSSLLHTVKYAFRSWFRGLTYLLQQSHRCNRLSSVSAPHRPHPANPVYHSPRLGTSLRPILVIVTRGNVVCSPKHRTSDLGPVSNGKSWHGGHVSPLHHTCSIQRSSFERDTYPCNSGPCLILPFAPPVAPPLAHYLALMVQVRL